MRVNEIFYSLQGEGAFAGSAAIFIRLSGCNLKCDFCDTKHQWHSEVSLDEMLKIIKEYPAKHIVFTGGEPSLQLNAEILHFFKTHGYFIQIETNGTNKLPLVGADWVTCSPKFEFCPHAEVKLEKINELKVVYNGKNDMSKYEEMQADFYFLQPCDVGDATKNEEIMQATVAYILAHPKWRLSLQTQKILNIR